MRVTIADALRVNAAKSDPRTLRTIALIREHARKSGRKLPIARRSTP